MLSIKKKNHRNFGQIYSLVMKIYEILYVFFKYSIKGGEIFKCKENMEIVSK